MAKTDFQSMLARFSGPATTRDFLSTGVYSLNWLFSRRPNGGIPQGQLSVLWGAYGSGKTTVALSTAGLATEKGLRVMWIDSENALDVKWANKFGLSFVSTAKQWTPGTALLFSSKDANTLSVEACLDLMEAAMQAGNPLKPDLIVIDSIYNLYSDRRIEASASDQHMALEAKAWSSKLGVIADLANINNVTVLGINQARETIGEMAKWVMPRGHAWRSDSSIIAYFRYDTQATGTTKDVPSFVAKLEKSRSGGLRGEEMRFQLRPLGSFPIDLPYDLITVGRECLFKTKTGKRYHSGSMFFENSSGELISLGKSISEATKRVAEDEVLAGQIMDALDNWTSEQMDATEDTGEIEDDNE